MDQQFPREVLAHLRPRPLRHDYQLRRPGPEYRNPGHARQLAIEDLRSWYQAAPSGTRQNIPQNGAGYRDHGLEIQLHPQRHHGFDCASTQEQDQPQGCLGGPFG